MSNSTVKAQKNCALEDRDIIGDILGSHKTLVKLYADSIIESANDNLRSELMTLMTECAQDQYEAFLYMSDNDMYETTPADKQQIECACDKYCQCSANC